MTDVARWVLAMDQPSAEDPGKAASFLRALAADEGIHPDLVADVQATLAGIWRAEGRVSSSYHTSARHAVLPWTRNEIRRLSETTTIDLDWLTSGNNSLYLAAPLMDQDLLAPAFGGLIADLVDQVILRHERTGRAPDRHGAPHDQRLPQRVPLPGQADCTLQACRRERALDTEARAVEKVLCSDRRSGQRAIGRGGGL